MNKNEMTGQVDVHPCSTCLRWWECNGVDCDSCPLCNVDKPGGGSGGKS